MDNSKRYFIFASSKNDTIYSKNEKHNSTYQSSTAPIGFVDGILLICFIIQTKKAVRENRRLFFIWMWVIGRPLVLGTSASRFDSCHPDQHCPFVQRSSTPDFDSGDSGSIPLWVTKLIYMGKSFKKTPIFGIAAKSNKKWKVQSHKKHRRKESVLLKNAEDFSLDLHDVSNVWASPQDGKLYWKDAKEKDMRK